MPNHVSEANLALFAGGDLAPWAKLRVRWHLARCSRCLELAQAFRNDQQALQMIAGELPLRVDWDRLSAEMTANIRVGLAAGECIASNTLITPKLERRPDHKLNPKPGPNLTRPGQREARSYRSEPRSWPAAWRVAAASVGIVVVMTGAWWLNTPARQTESLGRALWSALGRSSKLEHSAASPFSASPFNASPFNLGRRLFGADDPAFSVAVSTQGIELRENGARLGVTQGTDRPVAVSLNVKGMARARYVDEDTGQVTITSVYAQ